MFKKRSKLSLLLGGILLMATFITTGCGGAEAGANNVLTVAAGSDAVSLDPQGTNDSASALVLTQIYETLVNQDENMEILPGLATDWRQIDDYTWEFDLRENVYFHNGEPFTADDVKFTFQRAADASVIAAIVGVVNPDSIEVIDDHTVRIGTHEPFAPFLSHLAHVASAIINEEAVNYYGDDFGQNPVGTGPFKFENWILGDSIELVRNEEYHGEIPQVEELIIRNVTENSARTIELETGQVDIALDIAPVDMNRVNDADNLTLHRRENLATNFIYFNMLKEPFDNVLVRQAVNYALNVNEIVESVLEGVGTVATAPLGQAVWGVNSNLEPFPTDVERARELLAEAGFEDGFSTTIWTNDNQTRVDIATIVASQLREIGINVEVEVLEWGAYLDATDAGEHDMAILGWVALTGDADYGLFPMYHSSHFGGAGNRSFFADDHVDALLELARTSTDDQERLEAYYEVQEIVWEEAVKVWLNHGEVLVGTQANVNGFVALPTGHHCLANVYFAE